MLFYMAPLQGGSCIGKDDYGPDERSTSPEERTRCLAVKAVHSYSSWRKRERGEEILSNTVSVLLLLSLCNPLSTCSAMLQAGYNSCFLYNFNFYQYIKMQQIWKCCRHCLKNMIIFFFCLKREHFPQSIKGSVNNLCNIREYLSFGFHPLILNSFNILSNTSSKLLKGFCKHFSQVKVHFYKKNLKQK